MVLIPRRGLAIGVAFLLLLPAAAGAQAPGLEPVLATTTGDVQAWGATLAARIAAGELRPADSRPDAMVPGRTVDRFAQFHDGVPVWGAEVVVNRDGAVPASVFGALAPDLTLGVDPALSAGQARDALLAAAGGVGAVLDGPDLVVLPLEGGDARLAYVGVVGIGTAVTRAFVDASTGAALLRYSELQSQSAVGTGTGVLGDTKKVSTASVAGAFRADDLLRPPSLRSFDLRYSFSRLLTVLNGGPLADADLATDADNVWTDAQTVDAHTYVGWTYDYYFKRFGRRGLDDHDRPIVVLVNGVSQQGALNLAGGDFGTFAVNAFWCDSCGPGGIGVIYFGNGIPPGYYLLSNGHHYNFFAGALDIVAHELTHAVTSSTSNLVYLNESGALNEAFSDIMGTSVEFFFQEAGNGVGQADYVLGEDISRGVVSGATPNGDRSLADPGLFGDPDHYTLRYTGSADNGGVHINSGIANHAFYLAVEGGTNRTSGLAVQGVGAANREQIERVFYRAFTALLPASATFSTARAATIQAARDLYGAGSAAEAAVTQAWMAVGVF